MSQSPTPSQTARKVEEQICLVTLGKEQEQRPGQDPIANTGLGCKTKRYDCILKQESTSVCLLLPLSLVLCSLVFQERN